MGLNCPQNVYIYLVWSKNLKIIYPIGYKPKTNNQPKLVFISLKLLIVLGTYGLSTM